MSTESRGGWLFSLGVKLLAILIPLMGISMLVAMVGLSKFLQEFFHRSAEVETARLGQAVTSALRQSMLRGSEQPLSDNLADLEKTPGLRRVWIIDKNGGVAYAAPRAMIGRVLDKSRDPICTVCHTAGVTPRARTFFTVDETGTPIIRYVNPIVNEKVCWRCHDPKARLNGILLLEESTDTLHEAIGTIQRRLGATGGLTLAVLVVMTFFLTTVLVERPVRCLMAGVRQAGAGDLTVRIPLRGRDELVELASSFNVMTGNLGRSLQDVRNKKTELSVVYSVVERLTKTINLRELKEISLQTLMDVLDADRVLLLSNMTPQESEEILIRTRGDRRLHRIGPTAEGRGAQPEGFPSEIASRWVRDELQEALVWPDRQVAALPIQTRNRKLALLLVKRERPFDHSQANPMLLGALADHIGVAFENALLYRLAITDELTQLFTLRHFHTRIEECARHQQKFGLLLIDLDHFKAINDQWGHLAGDEVLRQVARLLARTIRVVDSAYRYGGEEFAVLLPERDFAAARGVAERVLQAVEGLEIPLQGGGKVAVTVSVGIAICPDDGTSAQKLVAAADAALYEAKRGGRNRVSALPRAT
jgi:diguanylate cyclase (GGDEF)-like protein